ncbi:hypothetical protein ACP4OV_008456 [Aristida adscensionis]
MNEAEVAEQEDAEEEEALSGSSCSSLSCPSEDIVWLRGSGGDVLQDHAALLIDEQSFDGKAEEEATSTAMEGLVLAEEEATSTAMEGLVLAEEDGSAEEPATSAAVAKLEKAWTAEDGMFEEAELAEEPAMATAVRKLQDALAEITRAAEMAEGRDLTSMACLAEWADTLRDAAQQGRAILGIFSDAKADIQEADQLCSAVGIMEDLALDAHCFINLVSLCPSI